MLISENLETNKTEQHKKGSPVGHTQKQFEQVKQKLWGDCPKERLVAASALGDTETATLQEVLVRDCLVTQPKCSRIRLQKSAYLDMLRFLDESGVH